MEEKLLHPDKVLDDLGTEVVDRLVLARLQSFSSLWVFVVVFFFFFDPLPSSPSTPTANVWIRLQVWLEGK